MLVMHDQQQTLFCQSISYRHAPGSSDGWMASRQRLHDVACTVDKKAGNGAARAVLQDHDSDGPGRTWEIYRQHLERRQVRAELQQRSRHRQDKRSAREKCEEQMNWTCHCALRRE